jgi:threonine/homoserine/homoserine lactone efflux protein
MIFTAILYGVLLGITLSFMVGPVFLVLLDTAIRKGAREAIVFDLGVMAADICFIALAFFSSGFLEAFQKSTLPFLIGGLAIVGFGLFTMLKKRPIALPENLDLQEPPGIGGLMLKGFLLNFLNVGVLAYWLTMSVIISHDFDYQRLPVATFFAASLLFYFLTDLAKIYFAGKLRRFMTPRRMQWLEKAVGLILLGFGVLVILRAFWDI